MAEYIEREALLEKFTNDENQDNKAMGIGEFLFAVIRGIIENQPTADVVEVVRCKDCVHHKDDIITEDIVWCGISGLSHLRNYYCACGKGEGE